MSGFKLTSKYQPLGDQPKAIDSLVKGLENKHRDQTLLGITGSGKTFTIANVIQKVQKPTLILSHNKTLAAQLYGEFKTLFPDNAVEYFISYYDYYQPEAYMPVTDTYIEKDSSINAEIDKLRIKSSTSLISRSDVIVIASVSCIYGVGSPKEYSDLLISVKKNQVIVPKELFKSLVDIHYIRNDIVLEGGIFRVRGDIVDIFPIYDVHPIRLEFFGNEIEKISIFDLITGEIIKEVNQVTFYPCKNFVTSRETINKGIKLIKKELFNRLKFLRNNGNLLEAQRLEQRTFYDIEMMLELGYCSGIENYSRHLDGRNKGERPYCLLDFFPDDFLMIIDESHVTIPQVRAMYKGDRSRKETLVEHGFRLPSALDNRPMKFDEFEEKINQVIYVSATPSEYENLLSDNNIIKQIIRPTGLLDPQIETHKTRGQIDFLIENIKKVVKRNERVLVTTITKKSAEDLTDYLNSMGLKCQYLHSDINSIERVKILRGLRLKHFDVLIGINLLREGLDLPEVSLVAVIDADKQGFLRSKSSLMQVAGRAARNINGKVILFGDVVTESMQYLINETKSRRKIQADFNKKNNITPKTILKNIDEIKSSTIVADKDIEEIINDDIELEISNLDEIELKDKVEEIERKMLNYAKELQFEKATLLRDQLEKLKNV